MFTASLAPQPQGSDSSFKINNVLAEVCSSGGAICSLRCPAASLLMIYKYCCPLLAKTVLPFTTVDAAHPCFQRLALNEAPHGSTQSPPPRLDQTHKREKASWEILQLAMLWILLKPKIQIVPAGRRTGRSVAAGVGRQMQSARLPLSLHTCYLLNLTLKPE